MYVCMYVRTYVRTYVHVCMYVFKPYLMMVKTWLQSNLPQITYIMDTIVNLPVHIPIQFIA